MIRVMIAAPASNSGKTVVTCALLCAMRARGLDPCAFKCGPKIRGISPNTTKISPSH